MIFGKNYHKESYCLSSFVFPEFPQELDMISHKNVVLKKNFADPLTSDFVSRFSQINYGDKKFLW